jgi:hypothetical protein
MYAARSWGYRHPDVCTGVRITAAYLLARGKSEARHHGQS